MNNKKNIYGLNQFCQKEKEELESLGVVRVSSRRLRGKVLFDKVKKFAKSLFKKS